MPRRATTENATGILVRHDAVRGYKGERNVASGQLRLLRVIIVKAMDLMKKDIFGASDPYCKVSLYKSERSSTLIDTPFSSKTIRRNLNPDWREEFILRVNPESNRLLFEIFDENRLTRDDFLGMVTVSLPHMDIAIERPDAHVLPMNYVLRPRSSRSRVKGKLCLYLAYLPDDNVPNTVLQRDPLTVEGVDVSNVASLPDAQSRSVSGLSILAETSSSPTPELPPNWEERVDNNGRTYYIDHLTRRTQWHRPDLPLPEGFEMRTDASNRVYYLDHVNRRTNWSHPLVVAAQQQLTLANNPNPGSDSQRELPNGPPPNATGGPSRSSTAEPPPPSGTLPRTSDETAEAAQAQAMEEAHQAFLHNPRRQVNLLDSVEPETAAVLPPPLVATSPRASHSTQSLNVTEDTSAPPLPNRNGNPSSLSTTASEPNMTPRPAPRRASAASVSDGNGPLPPGWSKGRTKAGRVFYIDHNSKVTTWEDPRTAKKVDPPTHEESKLISTAGKVNRLAELGPLPAGWEERVHKNGRIFYIDHNTKGTQWEDPRLGALAGTATLYNRNFKLKYDYFRSHLKPPADAKTKFEIRVHRKNILDDSFTVIMSVAKASLLHNTLWIEFLGEKGLDYGGVSREWFFLLSREMFNPYYGLFEYSATDNYTLQINHNSGIANPDHLRYFKFIGRVAGMAVYHGKLLDAFFIRPFYKMMLCKKITLHDMESVDSEYYRSLMFILENDPVDLDLNFSISEDLMGKTKEVDLIPNGRNIPVTNENKRQYIEKVISWRFVSRVEKQMSTFMEGFNEVVRLEELRIFDANEMELLLCGIQDINVKDWQSNTEYRGDYSANHATIVNFWKAVYSFNNETRSRLLQFVTGTSRVPMNGFAELWGSTGPQKFCIEKWGETHQLPRAHTCFNRIDLPPYVDYEELRAKLLIAIENMEGFAGVD